MVSEVPSTSEVLTFPRVIMAEPRWKQQYWARRGGETGALGERSSRIWKEAGPAPRRGRDV